MIINGQTFYEDSGTIKSPEFQYAYDSGRVTRSFQTRVPQGLSGGIGTNTSDVGRFNSATALIGYPIIGNTGVSRNGLQEHYLSRVIPAPYPAIVSGPPFNLNP